MLNTSGHGMYKHLHICVMEGLGTLLRKLLDGLDGGVQSHYDANDLNFRPRFYPVAQLLLAGGSAPIRTLANAVGVSHSALSQTVTEMRSAGLVTSSPGKDGRERLVRLTDEGLKECAKLEAIWAAIARAAATLEAELPMPLSELLGEAIARLQAKSFVSRIEEQLQGKVV